MNLVQRSLKRQGRATVTRAEGRARVRRGRLAEWLSMLVLMLKGYRILACRHRSRLGEIDLIAVRGRRIAFVEVKRRRSLGDAEMATTSVQADRIADAAEQWLWRRPAYRDHTIGLDLIVLAPWSLPRHLPDLLAA